MKRPDLKRVGDAARWIWPKSSSATVNWLWAGGIAGLGAGTAIELGVGYGLAAAGGLLLRTATLYARGS